MGDSEAGILMALREAGLINAGQAPAITRLSGGVSCDVFRVDLAEGPVCVKRTLPVLRVTADWQAPVERAQSEVAWLQVAREIGLEAPEVLADLPGRHLFVMRWFEPADYPLWKAQLASGTIDSGFAGRVGAALATIHNRTAGDAAIARRFANAAMFHALRIEPFLLHSAKAHADLAPTLHALAEQLGQTATALVHGDISPKNILAGPDGPVFLDAECACYGDPAFDAAFCLTHILLKTLWHPEWANRYLHSYWALAGAWRANANWEAPEALEARAAALIGALLLARVDGKSPVEYLDRARDRDFVRDAARDFLHQPPVTLGALAERWVMRREIWGQ